MLGLLGSRFSGFRGFRVQGFQEQAVVAGLSRVPLNPDTLVATKTLPTPHSKLVA